MPQRVGRKICIPDILILEDAEMQTVIVGKRGTVVIPAQIRKRYRLEEGSILLLEERMEGIFLRPSVAAPMDVDIYTQERLAEFFLNHGMDKEGYLDARKDVEKMGIDPDSINHFRWPD
jgi:AbrB family looped-hinge helix DNA binding protein